MRVFFYEAFEEEQRSLQQHLDRSIAAEFTWKTIQEHGAVEPPADLISIRTQSIIPPAWSAPLRGVLSRSTGYDHLIRYRQATAGAAVELGYLPLYCARAVAEHAMLLWMALLRRLPQQMKQFHSFHRDGLTGLECAGRTLLVVGVGHIGYEIVRIGRGLDMRVLGVDLWEEHKNVQYVSIEEGLPQADVIVCAMNLTEHNVGYFSRERLKTAKRGVIFTNVSRGECSPPDVLLELLDAGHLGGVGLDAYDRESVLAHTLRNGAETEDAMVRAELELATRPNAICTPHNAFNTIEAVERKSIDSAQQCLHFSMHGRFLWPVPNDSTDVPEQTSQGSATHA